MISAIYVALHRLIPCSEICGGRLDIGFFLFQKQGLCVTVDVDLEDSPESEFRIGSRRRIRNRYKATGESVLANNPDLSTDAGTSSIKKRIFQTSRGYIGNVSIFGILSTHPFIFCVGRLERYPYSFVSSKHLGQFAMVDRVSPKET